METDNTTTEDYQYLYEALQKRTEENAIHARKSRNHLYTMIQHLQGKLAMVIRENNTLRRKVSKQKCNKVLDS